MNDPDISNRPDAGAVIELTDVPEACELTILT
jgi:hypothetical protein